MSLLYPKGAPLFSSFQDTNKTDWKKQVSSDLASKEFSKLLLGESVDGISMYPFYTTEDIAQIFINYRVISDKSYTPNPWEFQEIIILSYDNTEAQGNQIALNALNQGAEALLFDCTALSQVPDVGILLKDIVVDGVTISWKLPTNLIEIPLDAFQNLHGVVHLNPIENFLKKNLDYQQGIDLLSTLLREEFPDLNKLSVSGVQFVESGASVIQEIGLMCNLLVSYLDMLTEQGHDAKVLFNSLEISLATRSAYFIDIAKYRAMQLLLHQLAGIYDVNYTSPFPIRAVSSTYNKSSYDTHANLLRNTAEAMAAVLGGCKTIAVAPHNGSQDNENIFGKRIARNVSHILRHEAHLDLVQDAVAGSYALESLTEQIATQAWRYFLDIEKEGGILEAFQTGRIQNDIARQASSLLNKACRLQKVYVGANRYIDPDGKMPDKKPVTNHHDSSESLKEINAPAEIENIRYQVDQAVARGSTRPLLGLIPINDKMKSSVFNARLSFVQDVLASVGINTEKLTGSFSTEHSSQMLAGFDALVLVGDDDQYTSWQANDLSMLIKDVEIPVMLAGYPAHMVSQQPSYGLSAFIHMGMHVPDFAHHFLKQIKFGLHEA